MQKENPLFGKKQFIAMGMALFIGSTVYLSDRYFRHGGMTGTDWLGFGLGLVAAMGILVFVVRHGNHQS